MNDLYRTFLALGFLGIILCGLDLMISWGVNIIILALLLTIFLLLGLKVSLLRLKISLWFIGICVLTIITYVVLDYTIDIEIGIVGFITLILLAIGVNASVKTKGFSFALFVFSAVLISLYWPQPFVSIGGFEMSLLIVPLLQLIMFGMGTSMSIRDFYGVLKMPKGVLVGVICQFTIMPFVGLGLAIIGEFPPEIAAGIVLIGSSPSGLASNVMAYLAKANVALSVTLTAVATLLAPLMTPLLMEHLAGEFIPIDFWSMMISIIKIVILPIILGLVFNHFFHGRISWFEKAMPIVSMGGIAVVITVITASGRDNLITLGFLLIIAAVFHNLLGYFFGYWGCRIFRMPERDCRTIAFEVGMQNGGLASGIALEMGKVATVGLAPAIFGPWMNISGSALASWWREKQTNKNHESPH
ncbi:MAG: bile acid:sodium symporter family protein [Flavobacteriaceae bacterium]|nr:bile acid:sodium symporter family protein [Flavobacteriaceae bacterium]